jgi:hypothetical protein
LNPNCDRSSAILTSLAKVIDIISAFAQLVNEVLSNTSTNHSTRTQEEARGDLFDRGEVDAQFAKKRIDSKIHDRDDDDNEDWVELRDNVVGYFAKVHGIGLRNKVSSHLIVCQPIYRIPKKDFASKKSTANLVHPLIIECHPSWDTIASRADYTWLDVIPEVFVTKVSLAIAMLVYPLVTREKTIIHDRTYVVAIFHDHFPLKANLMSFAAFAITDPVGGARV